MNARQLNLLHDIATEVHGNLDASTRAMGAMLVGVIGDEFVDEYNTQTEYDIPEDGIVLFSAGDFDAEGWTDGNVKDVTVEDVFQMLVERADQHEGIFAMLSALAEIEA